MSTKWRTRHDSNV